MSIVRVLLMRHTLSNGIEYCLSIVDETYLMLLLLLKRHTLSNGIEYCLSIVGKIYIVKW